MKQENNIEIVSYLVSDLGLVFFCLGADLPCPVSSLVRVSADTPLLDCSSILCLSYSRRKTSDREGGGWNVTGTLIGPGSCFASGLLLLRPLDVEFFLSIFEIKQLKHISKHLQSNSLMLSTLHCYS